MTARRGGRWLCVCVGVEISFKRLTLKMWTFFYAFEKI